MNLTYNIELEVDSATKEQIVKTLSVQREIVNFVSSNIVKNKIPLNLKLVHDFNYKLMKEQFPGVPSQILIKCEQEALASHKTLKKNKHKTKVIGKSGLSLRLDKRLYSKFTQTGIRVTVGGEKRADLKFKLYPKVVEMFAKYKPADPLLFVRDNRVFLSTTFEIPEILPKDDSVLGIDLGMRRLATTSDGNSIKSTEYLKGKRKIRYLKRCLQAKKTKSAARHLRKIKRKEHHFSKNYIHHLANEILKTDKSILVMEDLTKIKKKKHKHQNINAKSQIPFFMLRQILTYKAPRSGKTVATVNPAYTSKEDCRGLDYGVRRGCRYYAVDDRVLDADWNAAINIGRRVDGEHPISFRTPFDGGLNLLWAGSGQRAERRV